MIYHLLSNIPLLAWAILNYVLLLYLLKNVFIKIYLNLYKITQNPITDIKSFLNEYTYFLYILLLPIKVSINISNKLLYVFFSS